MPDLQYEHGVFVNCPFDSEYPFMIDRQYELHVFINVPDPAYRPTFNAIVFTMLDCSHRVARTNMGRFDRGTLFRWLN
jgi:hypothetical protein